MVVPGDPRRAALFAMQDALLTHRINGVYAAMWASATLSLALAGLPPLDAVRAALRHVPPRTRTHAAVAGVLADRERGHPWEQEIHLLHERHDEDGWVHAVPNVAAIAAALAWGEGDLGRTIGFALAIGWDTDSAGAAAGSIVGGWRGASALPASWTDPLDDRIRSSVRGFDGVSISEVAKRTCAVRDRVMVQR
jgi:ADP-ribosylglycohydrolase